MIQVMTFNLRYGDAPDGDEHWDRRKALALARIQAAQPDVLGLQECQAGAQAEFVRDSLPGYVFLGAIRGGDAAASEMTPLLYRRDVFGLLASGHFWLSETPDLPGSRGWDADFARVVTWARLRHAPTGRTLTFANTHFDYQPLAGAGSARVLDHWLQNTCASSPVIVTGDFNADKDSSAYRLLTAPGHLIDAVRAPDPRAPDVHTYHAFGRVPLGGPIDWILISDDFAVSEAMVDRTQQGGLYPSDHYPVAARLAWRGDLSPEGAGRD
jgi:endonuclease/exonuclease/phosphatase family metal-dependent hydrolase